MFHFKFVPLHANYSAKLIIYDENSANKYVNNCYRNGIFPRKSAFSQEWHLFVAAYSRQQGHAPARHSLRHRPGPRDAQQE